ncbi:MAG: TetR/AcrR family transcriptional regulator [Thermoguttaceae bacterium]|nr:TetR/AcrR family transcriptional regulator [Thermoguttaceae bacterium]
MQKESTTAEPSERSEAILQQAIRTFAELGFRATDVQVIADRAGVGKGTVYRHFGTKEELFWSAAFEVFKRMRATLVQAESEVSGAVAKLRAACLAYGRFFEQNPDYLEVFVQDRAEFRGTGPETYKHDHEELLRHFLGIVEQGIADGELRPIDQRKSMIAFSGLLYGVSVQGCYLLDGLSMQEVVEHGVEVFLAGMQTHRAASGGCAPKQPTTDDLTPPPSETPTQP